MRHSGEWMLKLGDGTEESHRRAQRALDELWRFTPELFVADDVAARLAAQGIAPDLPALRAQWETIVRDVVDRATLTLPHDRRTRRICAADARGCTASTSVTCSPRCRSSHARIPGAKW